MPEKASDIWWLFSRQTVSITTKESILNSALIMKNRNFRHLPVLSNSGRIEGIISAQDIIDSLNLTLQSSITANELRSSLEIPVERIMTVQPIVVEPGDGLREVIKKFCYYNIGALPVVNILGVVEGIITLRDLVGLMGTSSSPLNVQVSEIMSTNITTAQPELSLMQAVKLMSEKRVRRLPVTNEKEEPIGVMTNKDVLRQIGRISGGGNQSSGFERSISEFMTADVITIPSESDLRVAANQMSTFGVGGLIINDLPTKKLAILTERDLITRLSSKRGIDFLMESMQYELEAEDSLLRPRS